eukprot:272792-Alexandrium_andersonii.AAC.1
MPPPSSQTPEARQLGQKTHVLGGLNTCALWRHPAGLCFSFRHLRRCWIQDFGNSAGGPERPPAFQI